MLGPVISERSKLIIKEVDVVEAGCVSKPSLKWWQCLVVGAEEVNWLFNPFLSRLCLAVEAEEAEWGSKPSLGRLLCFPVA